MKKLALAALAALFALGVASTPARSADIPAQPRVVTKAPVIDIATSHDFIVPPVFFWHESFFKHIVLEKHLFFKKTDFWGWKKLLYAVKDGYQIVDIDIVEKGYGYHKKKFVDVDLEKHIDIEKKLSSTTKTVDAIVTCITTNASVAGMAGEPKNAKWLGVQVARNAVCIPVAYAVSGLAQFTPVGGVIGVATGIVVVDLGMKASGMKPWQQPEEALWMCRPGSGCDGEFNRYVANPQPAYTSM